MQPVSAPQMFRWVREGFALAIVACGAVVVSGCGQAQSESQGAASAHDGTVRATSSPVGFIGLRLAGSDIPVVLALPDGEDPGDWRPNPEAISAFQRSMLILVNGAGFEAWVETAALPRSRVVLAAERARLELIQTEAVIHSHGAMGEHSHGGLDPHTWLDPIQLKLKAEVIAAALRQASPDRANAIDARLAVLSDELLELHDALAAIEVSGVRLLASHPAYNYLARRMGWQIESFHFEPDAMPEEPHWQELVEAIGTGDGPVLMLWEDEPDEAIASKMLDELGIHSVVFSPHDSGPIEEYLDVMRENVTRLIEALTMIRAGSGQAG